MANQNNFDPDIVHDAQFACKDMGETAAEMVSLQFTPDEIIQFLKIYTKALKQLIKEGLWNIRSNKEMPQPDIFISEGVKLSEEQVDLLGKMQEMVDSYFDEDLFVKLADGDPDGPYASTHYPFAPYGRYWYEFYHKLNNMF